MGMLLLVIWKRTKDDLVTLFPHRSDESLAGVNNAREAGSTQVVSHAAR